MEDTKQYSLRLLSKGYVFVLICVFLFVSTVFFAIEVYSGLSKNLSIRNSDSLDLIDQRLQTVFLEINNFPKTASGDLLFISKLSCLKKFINFQELNSYKGLTKDVYGELIAGNFLEFLKTSAVYYQLRYLDEGGDEVFRVESTDGEALLIEEDELQYKGDRYYFTETMKIDKGDVFITSLDLNVEDGVIENKGTQENPEYVPIMRYGSPLFDDTGARKGVVISNIHANYFLDDIRNFQREGETTFLINNEGYYLAHADKSKEFAFMFEDKDDNFLSDYPEVARSVIGNCNERRIETDDFIFTYRCIYPKSGTFGIYAGSQKGTGDVEDYYWVLVTASDKQEVKKTFEDIWNTYMWTLLLFSFIILIVMVLASILTFKDFKKYER